MSLFGYDPEAAEYQRQQLNLMRRHQGLAPIPPPPYPQNLMVWAFRIAIRWMISAYLVFGVVAYFVHPLLGVVCGIACFGWLTHRRGEQLRRQRVRQLDDWHRAGCP